MIRKKFFFTIIVTLLLSASGFLILNGLSAVETDFDLLLDNGETVSYFDHLTNDSFNYAWSPDQDRIIYLSATSHTLKVVDLNGDLESEFTLPYPDEEVQKIHDLSWFESNKVSFILNDSIINFNLDDYSTIILFSSDTGIRDICWAARGTKLFVVANSESKLVPKLHQFDSVQSSWTEMPFDLSFFSSITCSPNQHKILIKGQNDEVISFNNGIISRQDIILNNARFIASLDEIPNSYFAINTGGRRSQYCIHLVNYSIPRTLPLIGMYRSTIVSLSFSSTHNVLLIETLGYGSGSKLYKRQLNLSEDNIPSLDDLVNCNM